MQFTQKHAAVVLFAFAFTFGAGADAVPADVEEIIPETAMNQADIPVRAAGPQKWPEMGDQFVQELLKIGWVAKSTMGAMASAYFATQAVGGTYKHLSKLSGSLQPSLDSSNEMIGFLNTLSSIPHKGVKTMVKVLPEALRSVNAKISENQNWLNGRAAAFNSKVNQYYGVPGLHGGYDNYQKLKKETIYRIEKNLMPIRMIKRCIQRGWIGPDNYGNSKHRREERGYTRAASEQQLVARALSKACRRLIDRKKSFADYKNALKSLKREYEKHNAATQRVISFMNTPVQQVNNAASNARKSLNAINTMKSAFDKVVSVMRHKICVIPVLEFAGCPHRLSIEQILKTMGTALGPLTSIVENLLDPVLKPVTALINKAMDPLTSKLKNLLKSSRNGGKFENLHIAAPPKVDSNLPSKPDLSFLREGRDWSGGNACLEADNCRPVRGPSIPFHPGKGTVFKVFSFKCAHRTLLLHRD